MNQHACGCCKGKEQNDEMLQWFKNIVLLKKSNVSRVDQISDLIATVI